MKYKAAALLTAWIITGAASAHDFWIEPATFRTEPGASLKIGLRVGERFAGEPVKRDPKRIRSFVIVGPAGEASIPGMDGSDDPAGLAEINQPGIYVIGYRTNHASIELPAEKFEDYLKEEGLEHIITERANRGESSRSAKEIYSRCAKAIVLAGSGQGVGHDRLLGFPLELTIDESPAAMRPGKELSVRLLFHGRPLEGAKITAKNRGQGNDAIAAKTDAEGRAKLRLDRAGVWLVTSVHMFPAKTENKADWESLWASLIFEIPEP